MDVRKKLHMVKKLKNGEKVALTVRFSATEYRQLMDLMYELKQRKFQSFITRILKVVRENPKAFDIESDY